MANKPIGILGGMGPEATILLQQRLLASVPAKDDADHLPLLVHMNPQVPSRLDWILDKTGRDPAPVLANMATCLQQAGAGMLAMPCNTAHYFAEAIESSVDIPFLNMVKLASTHALGLAGQGGRVGILASPATKSVAVFDRELEALGLSSLYPQDQDNLLSAIRAIKAGKLGDLEKQALQAGARECQKAGAQCIIVACTEFSLIAESAAVGIPVIDSLDVLVSSIVSASQQSA